MQVNSSENLLYHICSQQAWQAGEEQGEYRAESLESEGFIHCSTVHQVVGTANLLFGGQSNLLLLLIQADQVQAEIKYENTTGGEELFPHIYGPLNLNAVIKTLPFIPNSQGVFELPAS